MTSPRPNDESRPSVPVIVAGGMVLLALAAVVDGMTATGSSAMLRTVFVLPIVLASLPLRSRVATFGTVAASVLPSTCLAPGPPADVLARVLLLGVIAELGYRWTTTRDDVQRVAERDSLTGVSNTTGFRRRVAEEIGRLDRGGGPFSLLVLDVDRFKAVNDELGHVVGDRCLKLIARTLVASTRGYDVVGRIGGDEFAVLLPNAATTGAETVASRIGTALAEAIRAAGWNVTVGIGGATFEVPPASVESALHAADRVMYEGKRASSSVD